MTKEQVTQGIQILTQIKALAEEISIITHTNFPEAVRINFNSPRTPTFYLVGCSDQIRDLLISSKRHQLLLLEQKLKDL